MKKRNMLYFCLKLCYYIGLHYVNSNKLQFVKEKYKLLTIKYGVHLHDLYENVDSYPE